MALVRPYWFCKAQHFQTNCWYSSPALVLDSFILSFPFLLIVLFANCSIISVGEEEHDQEGRVIVAEYDAFVLVTAYVPNAGRGLVRLEYRQRWDEAFRKFLKGLASRKPLVLCGDLNVAHEEIDLRNPKGNKKNAGFTPQERQGFGELLRAVPLADSFRHLYPNTAYAYTFWTYMMNARSKNVGWRLDYFLLSQSLLPALCDSKIRSKALGSDHCPITLYLALWHLFQITLSLGNKPTKLALNFLPPDFFNNCCLEKSALYFPSKLWIL